MSYRPRRGHSGFIVWRYKLQRDDESPAPWTEEGKQRIEELGLKLLHPTNELVKTSDDSDGEEDGSVRKKRKVEEYQLPDNIQALIKKDLPNKKKWKDLMSSCAKGKTMFLKNVKDA